MDEEQSNPQASAWSFDTNASHAGKVYFGVAEATLVPTVKPLHVSTTYLAASIEEMDQVFGGERQGFVYGRYANPTTSELERVVALLEGGQPENSTAFGSGMAA